LSNSATLANDNMSILFRLITIR